MPEDQKPADQPADGAEGAASKPDTGPEFKPITSQDDLNKALAARLDRERAKFAGFDEMKTKAAEYDKAQEAAKTEAQRLADRATAAEKRAEAAESKALRSDVASTKGVPASSLTGTTQEELEASADALIAWRDQQATVRKTPAPGGLKSGASKTADAMTDKERAAAALRSLRTGT